jgi:hypothetical protein
MLEDAAHVVRDGAHDEAVEQRHVALGAGAGQDPAGRQILEAGERVVEAVGPLRAHLRRLGLGQRLGDPAPAVLDGLVDRRAVRPLEPVFHVPDLLRDRGYLRHR